MSKFRVRLDSEVVRRWANTLAPIWFTVVLWPRLGDAVEHPTFWNWLFVVAVLAGAVTFAIDAVRMWRKHLARGTTAARPLVATDDVPSVDVQSAIAGTKNRISAIKALRERHCGLGLKDAADLVDAALAARSE